MVVGADPLDGGFLLLLLKEGVRAEVRGLVDGRGVGLG